MSAPVCPEHNLEMTFVPAGVAKKGPRAGQPYPAFWKCPLQGCSNKFETQAPQQAAVQPAPAPKPASVPVGSSTPRMQAAVAAVEAASRVYEGTRDHTGMKQLASELYHELLKPAFAGDMPVLGTEPAEEAWSS